MSSQTVDPIIFDSVLARLVVVREKLASADADVEAARNALERAQAVRADLDDQRSRLEQFLEAHGATQGSVEGSGTANTQTTQANAEPVAAPEQINSKRAVQLAQEILRGGKQYKASEIYAQIQARGYFLSAEDPARRLTHALSVSGLFDADRTLGWKLKDPTVGDA